MLVSLQEFQESSDPFPLINGTKQSWVLAPTLFFIVFSIMLFDAFHYLDNGVYINFRLDGGLFNLQARTNTLTMLIHEVLYADDYVHMVHSVEETQLRTSMFAQVSERFGLAIKIKKTEDMYQPAPDIS